MNGAQSAVRGRPAGRYMHLWVIMGPTGSGKSTVGRYLAEQLGFTFVEGDDYHPACNRAKMNAGTPLTDLDRESWLLSLGNAAVSAATHTHVAVACSALKASYRDAFRIAVDKSRRPILLHFLYLKMDEGLAYDVVDERARQTGHFMPASLVRSQYETLEEPGSDERDCLEVDAGGSTEDMKKDALALVRRNMR